MRGMLSLIGLLVVLFVGVGWYRDWFSIATGPGKEAGKTSVNIDLDTAKIGRDVQAGTSAVTSKVKAWLDKLNDKAPAHASAPAKAGNPAPAAPVPTYW